MKGCNIKSGGAEVIDSQDKYIHTASASGTELLSSNRALAIFKHLWHRRTSKWISVLS